MKKLWTESEIEMLHANELPPGRTLQSAHVKAYKLGISFCPTSPKSGKAQKELASRVKDYVIDEIRRTGNVRATARKFGVSYTTVSDIARKEGITVNETSVQRRAETIVFEGKNYAWHSTGYYWRCTSGKRESLARIIYERAHGPIDGRKMVVFRDGNRYNFDIDNLVCMTPREFALNRQEKEPLYHAQCLAALTLGRLRTQINETLDPELKKKRMDKVWKSRRQKAGVAA